MSLQITHSGIFSQSYIPDPPQLLENPVLTGNPYLDEVLTCSSGSFSGESLTISYQWLLNNTPIPGETSSNLLISGSISHGSNITCEVTATNLGGSASGESNELTVVWPPARVSGGSISGDTDPGATLTASDPTWSRETSTSREWRKNGAATGSTGTTYSSTADGDTVLCRFTASNAAGSTSYDSNEIEVEAPPPPVISGFAFPGETLTSDQEGQWYVDGVPVGAADATTFAPKIQDIGLDIWQENANGESNMLECWHPSEVSQCKSCRVAFAGTFNASALPAADGEAVANWVGVVGGFDATQATGTSRPVLDVDAFGAGFPGISSDGGDFFNANQAGELALTNGAGWAAVLLSCAFSNIGSIITAYSIRNGTNTNARILVSAKTSNVTRVTGTSLDSDPAGQVDCGAPAYNTPTTLLSILDAASGQIRMQRDGGTLFSSSLPSGPGNISSTNAAGSQIFQSTLGFVGPMACSMVLIGQPSALDLRRLRQFAGRCAGQNLGLDVTTP